MKNEMIKSKVKMVLNMTASHCNMLSKTYAVVAKTLSNAQLQDVISNTAAIIVQEIDTCIEQIKTNEDLKHDFEELGALIEKHDEEMFDLKNDFNKAA